jgi:hypothetical protein
MQTIAAKAASGLSASRFSFQKLVVLVRIEPRKEQCPEFLTIFKA